jgi:hypothetical protein
MNTRNANGTRNNSMYNIKAGSKGKHLNISFEVYHTYTVGKTVYI